MMEAGLPSAPILILGANASEVNIFHAALEQPEHATYAGFPYVSGTIAGLPAIVTVTGYGLTNGAMVSALFAQAFQPSALILSGTGSRFNPRIRTGDVVISRLTTHHAAGSLTDAGMVYRKIRGPLKNQLTSWHFRPDAALFACAKRAIGTYEPKPIEVDGSRYIPRVVVGTNCASDLFGVNDEKIADMREKLNPDIMEMESSAVAQVCTQLGTPHIVFRAGSNITQSNPGNDYRRLGQIAARAAARWTLHFIAHLSAERRLPDV